MTTIVFGTGLVPQSKSSTISVKASPTERACGSWPSSITHVKYFLEDKPL